MGFDRSETMGAVVEVDEVRRGEDMGNEKKESKIHSPEMGRSESQIPRQGDQRVGDGPPRFLERESIHHTKMGEQVKSESLSCLFPSGMRGKEISAAVEPAWDGG